MNLRDITRTAMLAALAVVLGFVSLFTLANGGRVSLEMVPILTAALWLGWRAGLAVGLVYALTEFIRMPVAVHPLQVVLDYPLAFSILALAGLYRGTSPWGTAGVVAAVCMLRLLAHFISGVYFFPPFHAYASLLYNGSYMLPQTLVCAMLLPVIVPRLRTLST